MKNSIQYPKMKADRWCFALDIAMAVGCVVTVVVVFVGYVFRLAWPWLSVIVLAGACWAIASGVGFVLALLVRRYQRRAMMKHYVCMNDGHYPGLAEPDRVSVNIFYGDGDVQLLSNGEEAILMHRVVHLENEVAELLDVEPEDAKMYMHLIRLAASRPKARNSTKVGFNGMAVSCMLLALIAEKRLDTKKWLTDKKSTMKLLALINGTCIYEDNHFLDYFNAAEPYPKNQQKLINDYRQQIRETFD